MSSTAAIRRTLRRLALGALVCALALCTWSLWLEPDSLVVRTYQIPLPGWPAELDGLRIAALSDLHIGSPFVGLNKLKRVVTETNRTRPDVTVLLGDYVIRGVAGGHFVEPEPIARELQLLDPPLGTFAVLGNHDRWYDASRVSAAFASRGIQLLENRAARIRWHRGEFWLAGLQDLWSGRPDVAGTLASVPAGAALICMTHNPDLFPSIPSVVNLTLAGHTHGGQVNLPLIGAPIVPSRYGDRFVAGLIEQGGRRLFVTTGIGTSVLPVRFRVPPEISVLVLRSVPTGPDPT